ncbi:MAG TPA: SDR family NAD(P)-dependent oxidoreductase, partial [Solirubrobacteraceae bacterium]|nr:SDR family NAD(P)-dependent oxidoreductase [Solirubrobacteraceae bacterium]
MDLELEGKCFLITGGSSGLGKALGLRLAKEKANVAIMARDLQRISGAAGELRNIGAGGEVMALPGDVLDPVDLERFVEATEERWGRIDGVANNAGQMSAGRFAEHEDEVWAADLELKLMAAIRLTRLALPLLRVRGGAVLNTLAVSGKAPDALSTPTSVTRAAGLALTKALSRELAPEGIRVNAVLVGAVESPQLEGYAAQAKLSSADYYARLARESGIPMGRVGRP